MTLPLSDILVVSFEQAVAAPMCSCRLADAGARVIKIERPEGDFARGYDSAVHGESAYFVWLNRGKESVALDLAAPADKALFAALLAKADVFVQNLKPGAIAKLGFPIERLRRAHPRLIVCSISGYGEEGPYAARKAYDMLIQAESGLASITGGPETPSRVGVSVCDIAAGMNGYEAILEALIVRERSGAGAAISISMFDAMADWMAVPLLQYEGDMPPQRMGLAHTSISPYGAFRSRDGVDILISIQNDREWRVLAERVLGDAQLAADPNFASNVERMKRRAETDGRVATVFGEMDAVQLIEKLAAADIAFARVNEPKDLARHPHLRRITVDTPTGPVAYPAPPAQRAGETRRYGAVPALGAQTEKVRAEFGVNPAKLASLTLGKYEFKYVCDIEPERDENRAVRQVAPQSKYQNRSGLRLNKYGKGPFCKFKIPNQYNKSGVYVIKIDREPMYVGECENLSSRFNMGYGNISPRNCFVGGQETNCRVNNLILQAVTAGSLISLWFFETNDHKTIEGVLRASHRGNWNRV